MSRIICADAVAGLKALPSESVQMCVTSPPYYGLDIFEDTKRNYRTASLKKEILSRKNERFNISFDYKESLRKVGKFCFYHIHLLAINSRNMLYFLVES